MLETLLELTLVFYAYSTLVLNNAWKNSVILVENQFRCLKLVAYLVEILLEVCPIDIEKLL